MTRRVEPPAKTSQLVIDGLRQCDACGAYTGSECEHERRLGELDYGESKRRPRACLLSWDPSTFEWPEGF